jgi:signal transduction histidine kinase
MMNNGKSLIGERLWTILQIQQPSNFIPGGIPEKLVVFSAKVSSADGSEHIFSCSHSPIQIRKKTLLALIALDITEEQKLAAEKAQLAEQLAHTQRIESLGMLAGGIAHDFNNYIHAILGHIDVVTYMYEQKPEIQAHLQKVVTIAEQAGKLTSQLLGFARKGKYQIADLDTRELFQSCFALIAPHTRNSIQLTLNAPEELPRIKGDKIQIQQVFLNLLLNAADAVAESPEKKISVTLAPADRVEFPLQPFPTLGEIKPENYLCISIADNGHGIPPDVLDRIFEPFFTTKPVGKGTGMGLAMVCGTITNHQGWIQVVSQPGEGAVFHIFLPFSGEES